MTRPWLRLYRREAGSFAQLPLYVRAMAAEILKLTDDHGVIPIGNKEPWEAIAFALGATRSDRRMLKRDVGILLTDGYLVHDGQRLLVINFPRFQDTTEPPSSHSQAVTEPLSDHDGAANEPLTDHLPTTKSEPNTGNDSGQPREIKREIKRERRVNPQTPFGGWDENTAREVYISWFEKTFGRPPAKPPPITSPVLGTLVARAKSLERAEAHLARCVGDYHLTVRKAGSLAAIVDDEHWQRIELHGPGDRFFTPLSEAAAAPKRAGPAPPSEVVETPLPEGFDKSPEEIARLREERDRRLYG